MSNNRLQVGGLALLTNTFFPENEMKTVKLISFLGIGNSRKHGIRHDYWRIEGDGTTTNGVSGIIAHPAQYLIPLGDQQTQDELAKEKEHEHA